MGNGVAYLALAVWPLVSLILFRTLTLERALIWSILGAYLILPPVTEFNLPLVPSMNKATIPSLAALLIVLFGIDRRVQLLPRSKPALVLAGLLVLAAIPTVLTNRDPIPFEVLPEFEFIRFIIAELPGQSLRDVLSVLASQLLMIVPFLLARQFLSSEGALRDLLKALFAAGLIVALPVIIEVTLSPQLNIWVYGFFQHSFGQTMRMGGFRPILFLEHPLWVAMLVWSSLLAAVALVRTMPVLERWRMVCLAIFLAFILMLCKSLASMIYAVLLVPVMLLMPYRWIMRVAAVFAVIAVTYPMLRNMGVVPLDAILTQAEAIDPRRAHSLAFRFGNEERLLERAAERPLFGWGSWGRNLIHEAETGVNLSVPDGRWIIIFGTFGWLGYVSEFGLLAFPVFWLVWLYRGKQTVSPYAAALALILGIRMIDMLLNATLTPVVWMVAGALLGHAERLAWGPAPEPRSRGERLADRRAQGGIGSGKRTIL